LRRLTWHNPRILNAAHERIELFHIGVKSKILEAVHSRSAKRRRWGFDAMFDAYEFRDHLFASARWAAPAPCERAPVVVDAQLGLEREAAAELERERAVEADRWREGEEMVARKIEALDWGDADPVSEEPAPAIESPPAESESELPAWPGQYAAPPLVAHLYRPWTPPRQEPPRRVARTG
jgi:hypothetical protein